ncbi:MAG: hypothetical protein CBC83_04800 [Flavobacteriales bacterium TMED123]|nr:hypothetical protein [Candidatus Neomarinimicrobiota bacterium]OUV73960.1 MAG: hypothetical protein CBC83_04800 [Flavobacteriales bacterium TMED123]
MLGFAPIASNAVAAASVKELFGPKLTSVPINSSIENVTLTATAIIGPTPVRQFNSTVYHNTNAGLTDSSGNPLPANFVVKNKEEFPLDSGGTTVSSEHYFVQFGMGFFDASTTVENLLDVSGNVSQGFVKGTGEVGLSDQFANHFRLQTGVDNSGNPIFHADTPERFIYDRSIYQFPGDLFYDITKANLSQPSGTPAGAIHNPIDINLFFPHKAANTKVYKNSDNDVKNIRFYGSVADETIPAGYSEDTTATETLGDFTLGFNGVPVVVGAERATTRMLIVMHNPAASVPDSGIILQGLRTLDIDFTINPYQVQTFIGKLLHPNFDSQHELLIGGTLQTVDVYNPRLDPLTDCGMEAFYNPPLKDGLPFLATIENSDSTKPFTGLEATGFVRGSLKDLQQRGLVDANGNPIEGATDADGFIPSDPVFPPIFGASVELPTFPLFNLNFDFVANNSITVRVSDNDVFTQPDANNFNHPTTLNLAIGANSTAVPSDSRQSDAGLFFDLSQNIKVTTAMLRSPNYYGGVGSTGSLGNLIAAVYSGNTTSLNETTTPSTVPYIPLTQGLELRERGTDGAPSAFLQFNNGTFKLNKPNNVLIGSNTTTHIVKVVGGVYQIDGVIRPALSLIIGDSYIFDQSHSSNAGHFLVFNTAAGLGSGTARYETFVTNSGLSSGGTSGAFTKIYVDNVDHLYYGCHYHANMGNTAASGGFAISQPFYRAFASRLVANVDLTSQLATGQTGTLLEGEGTGSSAPVAGEVSGDALAQAFVNMFGVQRSGEVGQVQTELGNATVDTNTNKIDYRNSVGDVKVIHFSGVGSDRVPHQSIPFIDNGQQEQTATQISSIPVNYVARFDHYINYGTGFRDSTVTELQGTSAAGSFTHQTNSIIIIPTDERTEGIAHVTPALDTTGLLLNSGNLLLIVSEPLVSNFDATVSLGNITPIGKSQALLGLNPLGSSFDDEHPDGLESTFSTGTLSLSIGADPFDPVLGFGFSDLNTLVISQGQLFTLEGNVFDFPDGGGLLTGSVGTITPKVISNLVGVSNQTLLLGNLKGKLFLLMESGSNIGISGPDVTIELYGLIGIAERTNPALSARHLINDHDNRTNITKIKGNIRPFKEQGKDFSKHVSPHGPRTSILLTHFLSGINATGETELPTINTDTFISNVQSTTSIENITTESHNTLIIVGQETTGSVSATIPKVNAIVSGVESTTAVNSNIKVNSGSTLVATPSVGNIGIVSARVSVEKIISNVISLFENRAPQINTAGSLSTTVGNSATGNIDTTAVVFNFANFADKFTRENLVTASDTSRLITIASQNRKVFA